MIHGCITALISPFSNNSIDSSVFIDLIKNQNHARTQGIVVCGSTGEGSLLTLEERKEIIQLAVRYSDIPVIVGCSGASTQQCLEQVLQAESLHAYGVLVIPPFYSKPTQEGIYEHFRLIHNASSIPILLYNNPGRCGVNMEVDLVSSLLKLEKIVGIKDSTTDLSRINFLKAKNEASSILGGDDINVASALAQGADGFVSVTANLYPEKMRDFYLAWQKGDFCKFYLYNTKLMPVHKALTLESNPIMIKAALGLKNMCKNELRLPLTKAKEENVNLLKQSFLL